MKRIILSTILLLAILITFRVPIYSRDFTTPVAASFSVTLPTIGASTIALQGSVDDASIMTYEINGSGCSGCTGPSNGTLLGFNSATGAVVYTANAGYTGTDTFTYKVLANSVTSSAGTVIITVTNAKTTVQGKIIDGSGNPAVGTVTLFLTQSADSPDGLIPITATTTITLDVNGQYQVSLYPTQSLTPAAYYQVYFKRASPPSSSSELEGVYAVPASTITLTPSIWETYKLVNTNLQARFRFPRESTVDALIRSIGALAGGTHNLLSSTHPDTNSSASAVTAGDILYGNSSPKWDRLPKGTNGFVLTMVSGLPAWATPTGGADTALDNLASVSINTSLLAQSGVDLGSTTKPFRDLFIANTGAYGTNYFEIFGNATGARIQGLPDASGTFALNTIDNAWNIKQTITSSDANSFDVGRNGSTAPIFRIDSSTGSANSGFEIIGNNGAVNGPTFKMLTTTVGPVGFNMYASSGGAINFGTSNNTNEMVLSAGGALSIIGGFGLNTSLSTPSVITFTDGSGDSDTLTFQGGGSHTNLAFPNSPGTNGQTWTTDGAGDLTFGTLGVIGGGTGLATLSAGRIPFGNGTSAFGNSANFIWNTGSNYLQVSNQIGIGEAPVGLLDITGSQSGASGFARALRNVATLTAGANSDILTAEDVNTTFSDSTFSTVTHWFTRYRNAGTLKYAVDGNGNVTTGIWQGTKIGLAFGGTNVDLSATGGTGQVLRQSSTGANITVSQLAASDLSNGTSGSGAVALVTSPTFVTSLISPLYKAAADIILQPGANSTSAFQFKTFNGAVALRGDTSSSSGVVASSSDQIRFGINTLNAPLATFEMDSYENAELQHGVLLQQFGDPATGQVTPKIQFLANPTPSGVPTPPVLGVGVMNIAAGGYDGNAGATPLANLYLTAGRMRFITTENWDSTHHGTRFQLSLTPNASSTTGIVFLVDQDGTVFAGTNTDSATPTTGKYSSTRGLGSNIAGADVDWIAGAGTGTGSGGTHHFQGALVGSTGSTLNSYFDELTLSPVLANFSIPINAATYSSTAVSPAQITSNQNNYSPTAGRYQRWFSDASRTVTGMLAGRDGEIRHIWNIGSFPIILAQSSSSSSSGNRFSNETGADITLAAQQMAIAEYDSTNGTWRVSYPQGGTGAGGSGTVTSIVGGSGLTGGTITTSGTLAVDQSFSPTWTGVHSFTPAARTSGVAPYFKITQPSDTTLTASTAAPGFQIVGATRQWATGNIAENHEHELNGATYGFVGASTMTRSVNLYVLPNVRGTNATFTNNIGALFDTGNAADIPIYIKAFASQTGDLLQVANSSNSVIARITSTGTIRANGGTASVPSLAAGNTGDGIYQAQAADIAVTLGGNPIATFNNNATKQFTVSSDATIGFASTTNPAIAVNDTILRRVGAASIGLGDINAASPIAQTLSVQNVITGTSNTAGVDWTFKDSAGTGTGAGGKYLFQVAAAGSTGSAPNTWATALTIDSTSLITAAKSVSLQHVIGNTSAPTISAGTGAGTSPTASVAGTDLGGTVTVTTGTTPAGTNATVVTITFNVPYGVAPSAINLTPANALTAALSGVSMVFVDPTATSTTVFTIVSGTTALTTATTYKWFYTIVQ